MSYSATLILLAGLLVSAYLPDGNSEASPKKTSAIIAAPSTSTLESKQEVRILHIGDSHIQADFFTSEVRRLLRNYLRDTCPQRGFVFPFSTAGTNNPIDYKTTSTGSWSTFKSTNLRDTSAFGINGIALKTADLAATISLRIKDEKSRFNRVRIFYSSNNETTPTITGKFSIREIAKSKNGGSIDFTLSTKADSITIALKSKASSDEFILHGVLLEDTASTFCYHSIGLNGASTSSFLRCNLLPAETKSINPTHVIISLGTNDAYSPFFSPEGLESNLVALIGKVREAAPQATIILTTPGDFLAKGGVTTPTPKIAAAVITNVAEKNKCIAWDFFAQMGGEGSIDGWYKQGLASPDRLHLSKEGYKVQGRMFFEWLTGINS